MNDQYLYFAEVSLDISRGKYQAAIDKLAPYGNKYPDSYLFHLLSAKANRGLGRKTRATEHLTRCCTIAPGNQVAWHERQLLLTTPCTDCDDNNSTATPGIDPIAEELDQLSAALMQFEPIKTSENGNPTTIQEQKQPFADDTTISVPTESLATLFTTQGAYKKAIKIYTHLILLRPDEADRYRNTIETLLEQL